METEDTPPERQARVVPNAHPSAVLMQRMCDELIEVCKINKDAIEKGCEEKIDFLKAYRAVAAVRTLFFQIDAICAAAEKDGNHHPLYGNKIYPLIEPLYQALNDYWDRGTTPEFFASWKRPNPSSITNRKGKLVGVTVAAVCQHQNACNGTQRAACVFALNLCQKYLGKDDPDRPKSHETIKKWHRRAIFPVESEPNDEIYVEWAAGMHHLFMKRWDEPVHAIHDRPEARIEAVFAELIKDEVKV